MKILLSEGTEMKFNQNPWLYSQKAKKPTQHTFVGLCQGLFRNHEQEKTEDCFFAVFECTETKERRTWGCYEYCKEALDLFGEKAILAE